MGPKKQKGPEVLEAPTLFVFRFECAVSSCRALYANTRDCMCRQVFLASVLARKDQECLLSELKALQADSQDSVTLSNKSEVQAICGHLQEVSWPC